ncbi:MAG: glycosyltransferase family 39 protein [Phycisphaerales bacterium]|nr:MAG: glycosyltransferase family 39 protein [Phycisphaerales bacterium]
MPDSESPIKSPGQAEVPLSRPASRHQFWLALLIIELCLLLVHFNGIRVPHAEGDEAIFTFLALRLAESPGAYHLNGSLEGEAARLFHKSISVPLWGEKFSDLPTAEVLVYPADENGVQHPRYDPDLYGQAIFFHPPVYPYALAGFQSVFRIERAVLLSAACHLLAVLLIALLGRMLAGDIAGLIAAGFLSVEAVSYICGQRIWIDAMLQMTVAGSMLAAAWSVQKGGAVRFLLAGACLGLAGLTKFPAGAAVPAVVVLWLTAPRRPSLAHCSLYAAACGLPVLVWLIICKISCGSFLPAGFPTDWMMERYPYVERVVNRSPMFYFVGLMFASPILAFSFLGIARAGRQANLWMPVTWALSFVLILTLIGMMGMGFQLRYLAPAMPALCLLAAVGVMALPLWLRVTALPLAAYTLHVAMSTAMIEGAVDPPTPKGVFFFVWDVFGVRLASWFQGIW